MQCLVCFVSLTCLCIYVFAGKGKAAAQQPQTTKREYYVGKTKVFFRSQIFKVITCAVFETNQ